MDVEFGQDQQKNLLEKFVLTENCIIAEIYHISSLTPKEFFDPTLTPTFTKLLVDFSFFENKSLLENYVETTEEGRQAEEEFYNCYIDYLRKFSHLLNAICTFVYDFLEYADSYSSNQLRSLLDRRFSKLNSLKSEVLYLFGIILLLLENEFPGFAKERIFVAYYRSSAEFHSNLEMLVSLLRCRKKSFEICFLELKVNSAFVEHIINFLKAYNTLEDTDFLDAQISSEKQAAMIYTCLFFKPDFLHNQFNVMRQIVDKYFADKWVISLHFELKVNLCEKWNTYKAASAALQNTIHPLNASKNTKDRAKAISAFQFPSGLLSVENLGDYAKLISEYNAHLRWLILHSKGEYKHQKSANLQSTETITSKFSAKDLLTMLTKLAYFEYKFQTSCNNLIARKREDCSRLKSRVSSIFDQIIVFLENPVSMQTSTHWNEKLKNWLQTIKKCVMDLDLLSADSPQVLEHLQTKINEVSELHTGELIILKQYFCMVSCQLNRIMNICLLDTAFIERLNTGTNFIYLLQFLDQSTPHLEELLKQEALSVKHIFLKLSASITNLIGSVQDTSKREILSTFYHKRLEIRLKRIIQAIPRAIFIGIDELQNLFSPNETIQVQKQLIKQFADLDRRRLLAQKTSEITKLSLGISNMCISHLGSVEIQPRELLVDGLRKELHQKLEGVLILCEENILKSLSKQSIQLKAFRKAFLFVCEHIGINGVDMWQTEIQSVVGSAIHFQRTEVKKKLLLPNSAPQELNPYNKKLVAVQLVDYILSATNPRKSVYNYLRSEWRSVDGKKTEFCGDFFTAVESLFPGTALVSLQQIISYNIFSLLELLRHELEKASAVCDSIPHNIDCKWIESLKTSVAFNELQRKLVTIYCKIGQLKTLQITLKFGMEENLKVQMGAVLNASKNFLRTLSLEKRNCSLKDSDDACLYFASLGLDEETSQKSLHKSVKDTCVVLFISLVVYLSSATSTKKSEHIDRYIVLCGLAVTVKRLGLWDGFITLTHLFLHDENVLNTVRCSKNESSLLPVSTIPQALTK